jgi:hypothetical protein
VTDQPIIDASLEDKPLTVADVLDQAPSFHTILEVWRAILTPALDEKRSRITPQWASRICQKYPGMQFADMLEFRDRYFDKIEQLLALLSAEIETDDECLNRQTEEEDAEHNAGHYISILTDWQLAVLGWEMDWDCADPCAAIELAAIAETHEMFFGQTGLTALLDQINFEFTDMHRDALSLALQSYKDSREGEGE